ncbi:hypothetical protein TWF481_003133 [Arthrobotrys musiformis]|uniref:Uncharacterized protein n=1 Tax=Arthrobotrys musiformis TaxID=47236 RepID=A0AAV9VPE6_9PEZI
MELYYGRESSSAAPRRLFTNYKIRSDSRRDSSEARPIGFDDIINNIKLCLEEALQQPISFWPLCQPRMDGGRCPEFFNRIFWDCDCGMEMHADIPTAEFVGLSLVENPGPLVEIKSTEILPKKFEIYFSALGEDGADGMKPIKSDGLRTDKDLFQKLRDDYATIRGWKIWFSFTHVHDIRFVEIWLESRSSTRPRERSIWVDLWLTFRYTFGSPYLGELCNIRGENLPYVDDDEYAIEHRCPPNWVIRPMSRQAIMDHFSNPKDITAGSSDCLRLAMPKKTYPTSRSGFVDIWGLHAEEATCPAKIVVWGLVVHILCFAIGLSWWVVSVVYFGVVLANTVPRMREKRKYGYCYEHVYQYRL